MMFAFLLLAYGLSAQTFTPVDIWSGASSGYPYGLTSCNNKAYFEARSDTSVGYELWVSDGTPAGTMLVKDIWPGPGNSYPSGFTAVGSKVFFTAADSLHGRELWVTDGTTAGTSMVLDIWPGSTGSNPVSLTAYNGKLYFNANDSVHGAELWVSDGTAGGTSLVKDISPGTFSGTPYGYVPLLGSYGYAFNIINGKMYFSANDGTHGTELWVSDGTTAGTSMVADIWSGPGSSTPYFITPFNGSMIFSANDSVHGVETWISDGTTGGTSLLKDINPGISGSSPANNTAYIPYNGKLYFGATQAATGYELWSTDGTTAGTGLVKDILPGPNSGYPGYLYSIFVFNNKLFFAATDSVNGLQLWTSDGTTAGTSLFKILSSYTPYNSFPADMIIYNNRMIFTASLDTINQFELWTSDGTAAGTHVISPAVAPNPDPLILGGGNGIPYCVANGKLIMNAGFTAIGNELWIYATPTSITETSGDHSIRAYPNPFGSALSLSGLLSSETYTVQVYDMSGREFFSTEIEHPSDNVSLTMPDLSTGVYLMRVSGQSSTETFRLVKN